jgi:DNA repair protein RecO (recombination protein O)
MHGMVCEKCATQLPYSERTLLTDSTWYSLWFIATTPPERLYTFKVSDEVLEELSTIGEKYLTYSTNHKFSGAEMLALF